MLKVTAFKIKINAMKGKIDYYEIWSLEMNWIVYSNYIFHCVAGKKLISHKN